MNAEKARWILAIAYLRYLETDNLLYRFGPALNKPAKERINAALEQFAFVINQTSELLKNETMA